MFIAINDASEGKAFTLPKPLEHNSKIAIHRIDMWTGYYNIHEDQRCGWSQNGAAALNFTIDSGLYSFDELADKLAVTEGVTIADDRTKGLIEISIPAETQLWLTEPIRHLLGIDDEDGWFQSGGYIGDRPPAFTPKRLLIYLEQLSTTANFENKNQKIQPSQLLASIPLSGAAFGSFRTVTFNNPQFKVLQSNVHELDFNFKLDWGNGVRQKLDNHSLPLDLAVEIKCV